MYAFSFKLFHPSWLNTAIYNQLAETYRLPSIESLVVAMQEDIQWQCDPTTQVYYLDNLREPNRRDTFQIRFKTSQEARGFVDVFLSLEQDNKTVHLLALRFGGRGDRKCSSRILAWMKDAAKKQELEANFEIEGIGERDGLRFIREHSLSAFQWSEPLQRYLHVADEFKAVKEVKKGIIQ